MVNAYVTAKVDPGTEDEVRFRISKLNGVKKASVVYGDVDIIAEVEVRTLLELGELNSGMRRIPGIVKTETYLCRKER
nr:Lrp/AsnC ligand binding domain-containing protein [Candidatus Njordarchaeum guaymaensis]